MTRFRYHLVTLGSVLLLSAIAALLAALTGVMMAQHSEQRPHFVPGTGVTPIPTPVWSAPPR